MSRELVAILAVVAFAVLSSCAADDSHLWPAQLWREGKLYRVEDRVLVGTLTMEGDTCYLRLKNGSVSHEQNFIRDECFGTLFVRFIEKGALGDYDWGDIKKDGPQIRKVRRRPK